MHVSKEKKKSPGDRAEECMLLGYGTGNTYRLRTKKSRSIMVARDVKFDVT